MRVNIGVPQASILSPVTFALEYASKELKEYIRGKGGQIIFYADE